MVLVANTALNKCTNQITTNMYASILGGIYICGVISLTESNFSTAEHLQSIWQPGKDCYANLLSFFFFNSYVSQLWKSLQV